MRAAFFLSLLCLLHCLTGVGGQNTTTNTTTGPTFPTCFASAPATPKPSKCKLPSFQATGKGTCDNSDAAHTGSWCPNVVQVPCNQGGIPYYQAGACCIPLQTGHTCCEGETISSVCNSTATCCRASNKTLAGGNKMQCCLAGQECCPGAATLCCDKGFTCCGNVCCNSTATTCCGKDTCMPKSTGQCCENKKTVCNKFWEECCDEDCCNTALEKCVTYKTADGTVKKGCTRFEWLNTSRAFMAYGIPAMCCLVSVILMVATIFAFKAGKGVRKGIPQFIMIAIGYLLCIAGILLCFGPVWYNGILEVVLGVASVCIACTRSWVGVAGVLAMQYLMLIVFLNPYAPNLLLTFGEPGGVVRRIWWYLWASETVNPGDSDNWKWGSLWWGGQAPNPYQDKLWWCTDYYYGYFRIDAKVRDIGGLDNPGVVHYGFCGQMWMTILLIVSVISVILNLLLEAVTLVHLITCVTESSFFAKWRDSPAPKTVDDGFVDGGDGGDGYDGDGQVYGYDDNGDDNY